MWSPTQLKKVSLLIYFMARSTDGMPHQLRGNWESIVIGRPDTVWVTGGVLLYVAIFWSRLFRNTIFFNIKPLKILPDFLVQVSILIKYSRHVKQLIYFFEIDISEVN